MIDLKSARKTLRKSVAVNKANIQTLVVAKILVGKSKKIKSRARTVKLLKALKVVRAVVKAVRRAKKIIGNKVKIAHRIAKIKLTTKFVKGDYKKSTILKKKLNKALKKMVEIRHKRARSVRNEATAALKAAKKMNVKVNVTSKGCKCEHRMRSAFGANRRSH